MVKCPKCGAFSYPELSQCNMCGATLVPAASAKTPPVPIDSAAQVGETQLGPSPPIDESRPAAPDKTEVAEQGSISSGAAQSMAETALGERPETQSTAVNLDLGFRPERREVAAAATSARSLPQDPWRQEVSDRVLSFRQRRAKLRNESSDDQNLDFEFERSEPNSAVETDVERFLEFPQNAGRIDAEIGGPAALENDALYSDEETREPSDEVFEVTDSSRHRAEHFDIEPRPGNRLEIVVGPAEPETPAADSQLEEEAYQVASMQSRFLAGVIDGLFLLLSGGLFATIFSFAGGRLALAPLNLAVIGVIACMFVWSYFAMFTALASVTPGQSMMGIEARNMDGWPPDRRESLLRAFGYLVSLAAFTLGFFWALVDGESLTWHDRISGTFLTPRRQDVSTKGAASKT